MLSKHLCRRSLIPQRLHEEGFTDGMHLTSEVHCVPLLEIHNAQKHNKGPEKSCN